MCGENMLFGSPPIVAEGSPPRVRGKRGGALLSRGSRGITPVCAGKTQTMPLLVRKAGDHPRVCGENKAEDFLINRKAGSPPRVRRKPLRNNLKRPKTRITPACAGKTENGVECVMFDTDHPRVCGENHAEGLRRKPGFGSPPRVRGKLHQKWFS